MSVNTFLPPSPVVPPFLIITAITQSYPMVVTAAPSVTYTSSIYVVGQLVRFFVPSSYRMIQANGLTGQILAINGTSYTIDLDSTLFDAFVIPATYQPQPASLAPAGSRNIYNTQTEPFHSEGNTGN